MAMTPSDQLATLLRVMVGRVGKRVITGTFILLVSATAAPVIGHDGFPPSINEIGEIADEIGIAGGLAVALIGAFEPDENERGRRSTPKSKTAANDKEPENDEAGQSGSRKL